MPKKKKASVVLKELLVKKPLSSQEFINKALKANIKRSNFFTQRNNLLVKGEIKTFRDYQTGKILWKITEDSDKANLNEIDLCLDEMESNNKRLSSLGADEFVFLCQTKLVTHNPRVRFFFKKTFTENSFGDIQRKVLLAFKYVLARALENENRELFSSLLEENKLMLKKLAQDSPTVSDKGKVERGSIALKKTALSILALIKDTEILDILYDIIEKSISDEYDGFKSDIINIFRSYPNEYRHEIKRKLYQIATKENNKNKEEIIDRAINLLKDLVEKPQVTIYT